MIKANRERHERRLERLRERRDWKKEKPRPLNDLVRSTTGLIKWLLLLGGAIYLFLHGNGLLHLVTK
tara:strand:- start:470 stop:670 length:201 start_codon:yes stop_codon:yes gene_type:complete